jgi:hypothetical protein
MEKKRSLSPRSIPRLSLSDRNLIDPNLTIGSLPYYGPMQNVMKYLDPNSMTNLSQTAKMFRENFKKSQKEKNVKTFPKFFATMKDPFIQSLKGKTPQEIVKQLMIHNKKGLAKFYLQTFSESDYDLFRKLSKIYDKYIDYDVNIRELAEKEKEIKRLGYRRLSPKPRKRRSSDKHEKFLNQEEREMVRVMEKEARQKRQREDIERTQTTSQLPSDIIYEISRHLSEDDLDNFMASNPYVNRSLRRF